MDTSKTAWVSLLQIKYFSFWSRFFLGSVIRFERRQSFKQSIYLISNICTKRRNFSKISRSYFIFPISLSRFCLRTYFLYFLTSFFSLITWKKRMTIIFLRSFPQLDFAFIRVFVFVSAVLVKKGKF